MYCTGSAFTRRTLRVEIRPGLQSTAMKLLKSGAAGFVQEKVVFYFNDPGRSGSFGTIERIEMDTIVGIHRTMHRTTARCAAAFTRIARTRPRIVRTRPRIVRTRPGITRTRPGIARECAGVDDAGVSAHAGVDEHDVRIAQSRVGADPPTIHVHARVSGQIGAATRRAGGQQGATNHN